MTRLTPLKAIRYHCVVECEKGGSYKMVKNCLISDCALYEYRSGHNAMRKGIGNFKAKFTKAED
jgi:hypothetical protein